MNRTAILLAGVLAATYVSPAVGGPNLTAASLKRVDSREKRDYASLDRRIKATVLLTLNRNVTTQVVPALMTQSGGRFFTGMALCPNGTRLTGGGVNWGETPFEDWHVIASGPDVGGVAWKATLSTGTSPGATVSPSVYAVCANG